MTTNIPRSLSASSLMKDEVYNSRGEKLGDLHEIMIDLRSGRASYAVLSFGGLLGLGEKLFAIPWPLLKFDLENQRIVFDVTREQLEEADGFDKSNWPDFAEESFHTTTYGYWKATPYWAD